MISSDRKEIVLSVGLVLSVAVIGLLIWEIVVWHFDLPKALLPTPRQCLIAGIENRDALVKGVISTGIASLSGLAFAVGLGSLLAMLFSQSRKLRLAFFPYIILLQTVPIVAVAPLLIIWSGYTFRTVVIVTVIVCLFPIVNGVTTGLLSMDRDVLDLFRLYKSGRFKTLRSLQMPSAVGHLVLGTKTSAALAVIGAIVAEFFVGNGTSYDGLGTLMTGWQALAKTDALIAALFCSALLGLALFGGVQLIAVTILRRWVRP
ncbi:MAG: ABC transporter permease [Rubripirellula sp.]